MPMEETFGEYSRAEIEAMSGLELVSAQQRGFKRPVDQPVAVSVYPNKPTMDEPPTPSENVWASNRAESGVRDFVVPSGQKCQLRRLSPEMLLPLGILDRLTRLEGLAQGLVNAAEGQPPGKPNDLPSKADMELLLDTLARLLPVAVAQPKVYADDDQEAPEDAIRVSDIDLMDRVAIMEFGLRGVAKMDRFRNAG